MSFRKRRQLFVDPEFQGALLKRCLLHWTLCVVTGALLLLCWHVLSNPGEPSYVYFVEIWTTYWRGLIVAVVLLAVALIDFVRLSNRVCGPLLRLKSGLRQLAVGKSAPPMRFRKGDYWIDFALAFNAVSQRIQFYEAKCNEAEPSATTSPREPVAVSVVSKDT